MRFDVISIFPEMVMQVTQYGVVGRAYKQGLISLYTWNPRDYTEDKHKTVDDRPYGGGPGMVMKTKPLQDALLAAKQENSVPIVYLSPQGEVLTQALVKKLAQLPGLIFLAGRYEGIDERLITDIDLEISIGDYVLSGGELAVMVLIDAITRLLPNVLGHTQSAEQDSFMQGLLDHPHYTRPEYLNQQAVPEVLLGGNHALIARWRLKQALGRTWLKRPDLFEKLDLTSEQILLLQEFIKENRI